MTLQDYKKAIAKATSQKELREITYKAFLQDDQALSGKKTLYDKVITLAVKREQELAL